MVALDVGRALAAAGFDDVRVERALDEEVDAAVTGDLAGLFLEDADELAPDDLALLLGIRDAGQGGEEAFALIGEDEVDPGGSDEVLADLLHLALPQQAVVDEHAGELRADRLLHECRGDGGVDPARQRAEHVAVADLAADGVDGFGDHVLRGPVGVEAGDGEQEVLDDLLAPLRVEHLGVPLHAGELAVEVLERGHGRTRRAGQHLEALRGLGHAVAVAHPHVEGVRHRREQRPAVADRQRGAAVLALAGLVDRAAEALGHRLEAVADPQHRDTGLEDGRVDGGGAGRVDRRRSAGEDDRSGLLGHHLVDTQPVADDLRIDVGLTHATCDELCVLGAEVDDEHLLVGSHAVECSAKEPSGFLPGSGINLRSGRLPQT